MLKRTIAIAAIALALANSPSCGAKSTVPDQPVPPVADPTCTTVLDPPTRIGGGPTSAIVAYSHSTCTQTPLRHVISLRIEKLVDGVWSPVNGFVGTGSFRMCEALPYPGSGVACEWAVPCTIGSFRSAAVATGTSSAGVQFALTVPMKPEAKVASC